MPDQTQPDQPIAPNSLAPDLEYEETPIMEPIVEFPENTSVADNPALSPKQTQPPKRKKGFFGCLGTVLFVLILFILGVWLSSQIGPLLPKTNENPLPTLMPIETKSLLPTDTSTPEASSSPTVIATPIIQDRNFWQVFYILSGSTRQVIPGISYQMPSNIKAPTCDSGCVSQGTNLPGGTRFTIAPRGKGQLLPDFRNAILTDATGRAFTMSLITIGGRQVYEYVGDFQGSTGQGYAFSKIRGLLVSVNDNLSIEFNHFSNVGTVSDFDADDTLFNQIVGSVVIASSSASN
jgi:hypothetical protein